MNALRSGAEAAWNARFGSPAPRRFVGTASEECEAWAPHGWAWKMALAVAHDAPLPRLQGDDWDYGEIARLVRNAMVEGDAA
jgi:hypothetical protein